MPQHQYKYTLEVYSRELKALIFVSSRLNAREIEETKRAFRRELVSFSVFVWFDNIHREAIETNT